MQSMNIGGHRKQLDSSELLVHYPFRSIVLSAISPQQALDPENLFLTEAIKTFLNYIIAMRYRLVFGDEQPSNDYFFPIQEDIISQKQISFCNTQLESYFQHLSKINVRHFLENPHVTGMVYNELMFAYRERKKKNGQYYTPIPLVQSMVRSGIDVLKANAKMPDKILDPACGAGIFLIEAAKEIRMRQAEFESDATTFWMELFENILYGIDIDPIAVFLTRVNLGLFSGIKNIFPRNILTASFLWKNSADTADLPKFSWVIGNPPWGGKISPHELAHLRANYRIGVGEVNTFTAFLEHSLDRLTEGGVLSQLIPESLLNIRAHQLIRKELLEKGRVLSIQTLGDVFYGVYAPAIILQWKKEFMPFYHRVAYMKAGAEHAVRYFSQDRFLSNAHCIFSVREDNYSEKIFDIVERGNIRMHEIGNFYMGIVTGNNRKFLSQVQQQFDHEPVIVGRDLSPFHIKPSSNWIYFRQEHFQQVCDASFFRKEKKLLYKFISSSLRFAIDRDRRYHLNNINGFYLRDEIVSLEFLAALLNSDLINYYFKSKFFAYRILKGDLEKIPLRLPEKGLADELSALVIDIENSYDKEPSERETSIEPVHQRNFFRAQRLNHLVYDLYEVPKSLQKSIEENRYAS